MILCVLLKEKHEALIQGIFLMERNTAQGPRNEIWWKTVSLSKMHFCFLLGKMVHVVGLKIFLNLKLSLILPLSQTIGQRGVFVYLFVFLFCSLFFFVLFLFLFLFFYLFQRLIFLNCFYFSENSLFFETSINFRVRERPFRIKTWNDLYSKSQDDIF